MALSLSKLKKKIFVFMVKKFYKKYRISTLFILCPVLVKCVPTLVKRISVSGVAAMACVQFTGVAAMACVQFTGVAAMACVQFTTVSFKSIKFQF